MGPGPVVGIALVAVLGAACFLGLAWVWAKVLDDPARAARRRPRGLPRFQLVALPLLLLIWSVTPVPDAAPGAPAMDIPQRGPAAGLLVAAVLLLDQDLRRRADDPRSRHRLTPWGVGAIGAVVLGVAVVSAQVAATANEPVLAVELPAVLLALVAVAGLELLLALAIRRRWRRRRAEASGAAAPPAQPIDDRRGGNGGA
jgi:drug/metabolite transporter (DMT)-like permease